MTTITPALGHLQRQIMDELEEQPDSWVPLWELVDDPTRPHALTGALSAVRGLERRRLVATVRARDGYVAAGDGRVTSGVFVRLAHAIRST